MATRKPKRRRNGGTALTVNNLGTLVAELRPLVAKNKERAERLIRDIKKRNSRVAVDSYQIGVDLKALSQHELYGAAGYQSFRELVQDRQLMHPATAYRMIAVVDHYPKAQAIELGMGRAYALTRFVEATPALDLASTLFADNPKIGNKRLSEMSVRDLQAATARVRRASTRRQADPDAKAARAEARRLQRVLRTAGARSAKVRAIRREGEWHLKTVMRVEDGARFG